MIYFLFGMIAMGFIGGFWVVYQILFTEKIKTYKDLIDECNEVDKKIKNEKK
jgi:hypothetical protein